MLARRSILTILLATSAKGQTATTVFKGIPSLKVSAGATERIEEKLTQGQAANLQCVISKIGERYYWASRENVELRLTAVGAFHTYTALNGSGYIRIVAVKDLKLFNYDYVEHMLTMLSTVTYYGKAE